MTDNPKYIGFVVPAHESPTGHAFSIVTATDRIKGVKVITHECPHCKHKIRITIEDVDE